jgi:catechol 2,3-dioxygenase-like lactoylglutathione lyase family enzyme
MRLQTLTLTSRDLARSRTFYTTKLGFPVVEERAGESFIVDAGTVQLHVDAAGARSPLDAAEPRLVFHTRDLAERCLVLRDQGVSVEGPMFQDGGGRAELTDPDGHPITLVEN